MEIDARREEEDLRESAEDQKSQQIFQLKAEIGLLKSNNENGSNATGILSNMLLAGELVQDSDGNIAVNETRPGTKQKQSSFDTEGQ